MKKKSLITIKVSNPARISDNCALAVSPITTDRRLKSCVDQIVPDADSKILF